MSKIRELADKVRTAFFANTWLSFAMWLVASSAMAVLLFWFLGVSGFGETQAPVYEGF